MLIPTCSIGWYAQETMLWLAAAWLLMAAMPSTGSTVSGTRMVVDWPALLSGQDIVTDAAAKDSYRGLLLGNGDVAVSVHGQTDLLTLHVGRNDIWDYRDPMDEKRPRTHKKFLAMYADPSKPPIANYLSDPQVDAWNVDIRNTFGRPMPTTKPACKIRFRNTALSIGGYSARLHLWDASVSAGPEATRPVLQTRVSYSRNIVIAQYDPAEAGGFDIELARHRDCTGTIPNGPQFGSNGRDMWVRYGFPSDHANYPSGLEYVVYARVLGSDEVQTEVAPQFSKTVQATWRAGEIATNPAEVVEGAAIAHVRSTRPVTFLAAVVTTRDDAHPFDRAKSEVERAARAGTAVLIREHNDWWHSLWQRSLVYLPDKPFLNRTWSFTQYLLACCWRQGRTAPGLLGAWTWEDFPLFGNDYHWDYNMQQAVWGACSSNHLEQAAAYNETVTALLPMAVADARETYGIDGAKFFLTSYPRRYAHNPFPMLHYDKMMSLNGWVAHPMRWYYLYSQDREYLERKDYPVMRECAEFYDSCLTRAADGRYDIWPTAAWDVDFTPHLKCNRNFPMDLSFVRYLLNACVEASRVLGVDSDRRDKWHEIASNLREYPTRDTPEGRVFTAYEGSTSPDHFPLAVMMVFPGDDVGLDSPQNLIDTARRTIAPLTYSGDEQLLKAMVRARLGVDDLDAFESQLRATTRPNGTLSYGGQWFFWVHGCGNSIWLNENLVRSYNGLIRVAPVRLKTFARFCSIRASRAFLVSAEIEPGGKVAYVAIRSEAGEPCKLVKPWTGELRIRELSSMAPMTFRARDDRVVFATTKGAIYVVDRPTEPWECRPLSRIPQDKR